MPIGGNNRAGTQLRTRLAVAAALAVTATPALAERPSDRYWLTATGMFSTVRTTARIDRDNGLGTEISLERDIGLPGHESLPTVLAAGRLGEHWRLEFEYLRLQRSGSAIIDRSITIGDTTYDINSELGGRLRSETYRVGVGYSFVKSETAELGVAIGAHVTRFSTRFAGTSSTGGSFTSETRSVTAPLPTIGAYGTYVLSPMFSINGRADYLSLKIDNVKGKLIDTQLGVAARIVKNVSLGAGYRYVEYGIRADKNSFRGKLEYKYHGPVVFGELAF